MCPLSILIASLSLGGRRFLNTGMVNKRFSSIADGVLDDERKAPMSTKLTLQAAQQLLKKGSQKKSVKGGLRQLTRRDNPLQTTRKN